MMPGQTGLDFAGELRKTNDVPILMLTAMGETKDRIAGLEKGVDDYLGKPFEPRELLLRIQSVLRRGRPAEAGGDAGARSLSARMQFDLELGELTQKGKRVPLTDAEIALLRALGAQPGRGAEPRDAVQERGRRRQRARDRRAGDASAPQDRARSRLSRAICAPCAARATGWSTHERGAARATSFERIARWADRHSPQTLFARALIIIVVPMLLLQALSAWWFYSQRGDNVTNRLALLLVRDLRAADRAARRLSRRRAPRLDRRARARQDLLLYVSFRQGIVPAVPGARNISTSSPARSRARSMPTSSGPTTSTTTSAATRC